MYLSYMYRLRLTKKQEVLLTRWLELLRKLYNYLLSQRLAWWQEVLLNEQIFSYSLDDRYADLSRHRRDLQRREFKDTKELFPECKSVHSQVLRSCIDSVHKTCESFIKPDRSGFLSGKPHIKDSKCFNTFTYPQAKRDWLQKNHITLPHIGRVNFVNSRSIPDDYVFKTVTITRKPDGWYIALQFQVEPNQPDPQIKPNWSNTIGIDLGLDRFFTDSEGEYVPRPLFFPPHQAKLDKLASLRDRHSKGSKEYDQFDDRIAKLRQQIAKRRKNFHHQMVNRILAKSENYQFIACEDLNIKRMIDKSPEFRSAIYDAGWGEFLSILQYKAKRNGQSVILVNPYGTSQECSCCGNRVPKNIKQRIHLCHHCGLEIHRDVNAALNIKCRAVGITSFGDDPLKLSCVLQMTQCGKILHAS